MALQASLSASARLAEAEPSPAIPEAEANGTAAGGPRDAYGDEPEEASDDAYEREDAPRGAPSGHRPKRSSPGDVQQQRQQRGGSAKARAKAAAVDLPSLRERAWGAPALSRRLAQAAAAVPSKARGPGQQGGLRGPRSGQSQQAQAGAAPRQHARPQQQAVFDASTGRELTEPHSSSLLLSASFGGDAGSDALMPISPFTAAAATQRSGSSLGGRSDPPSLASARGSGAAASLLRRPPESPGAAETARSRRGASKTPPQQPPPPPGNSVHQTILRHASPVLGVPAANSSRLFTSSLRGSPPSPRPGSPLTPRSHGHSPRESGSGGGGASTRVLRGTIRDVKAALGDEGGYTSGGESEVGFTAKAESASPLPKAGALWGSVFGPQLSSKQQRQQSPGPSLPGSRQRAAAAAAVPAVGSPELSAGAAAALLSAAADFDGSHG